jgi:xanthine dehydrogenase YagT iron-sulfur-binding subunit
MADSPKIKFSRRGFIKGAGVTAATTVLETANALARETQDTDKVQGPEALPVKLHINGREHSVIIEPRDTLARRYATTSVSPGPKWFATAAPVRPAPCG